MSDNQIIIERIKMFSKSRNLSIRQFEMKLNFSNGLISSNEKRNGSLGLDKIIKICEKFRELSIEWLLFGKGEMLKIESEVQESQDQYIISENLNNQNSLTKICEEKVKGLEKLIEKQNEEIKFLRSLLKKD